MSDSEKSIVVTEHPGIGSLQPLVSAGEPRAPMPVSQDPSIVDWVEIPRPLKWWEYLKFWGSGRKYECGHSGAEDYIIRIWGIQVTPNRKNSRFCPDCAVKHLRSVAIRCCLCGFPILPGESVAFYNAEDVEPKDFDFTVVDDMALGCMRWDCCPSGIYLGGIWTGQGIDPPRLAHF